MKNETTEKREKVIRVWKEAEDYFKEAWNQLAGELEIKFSKKFSKREKYI